MCIILLYLKFYFHLFQRSKDNSTLSHISQVLHGLTEEKSKQRELEIKEIRQIARRMGFKTHVAIGILIHDLRSYQREMMELVTSITGESSADPEYLEFASGEASRGRAPRSSTQADFDSRRSFKRPFSRADPTRHTAGAKKPPDRAPPTPPPRQRTLIQTNPHKPARSINASKRA